ncbi:MAG: cytosine deaminase [Alphaproteobacteria bacterium]|nr:cytosine deaminase [Alphaproteobacteria bacterium]
MWRWPPRLAEGGTLLLADAAVPACLVDGAPPAARPDRDGLLRLDIAIEDGRIATIRPVSSPAGQGADMAGGQVWPCFVDLHTHLDKGHIWPRAENPDGTFDGAINAVLRDREANWSARDVAARMDFGLRASYAHGTVAVRTHIDSQPAQAAISWPVFAAMREQWRGRIELQAVTIIMVENLAGPYGEELADLLARHGGALGGVVAQSAGLDRHLDRIFALAAARGLDLDFHADESDNPQGMGLRAIAAAKLRHRFAGKVNVGHCCTLALQAPADVDRTLDRVAEAGLSIVSLPMCNMYLQDRAGGRTPRWRGVTLLHEMAARGIPVCVASDNCRDPFYGYGDHDGLEVFTQAARIAHLDRPIGAWPAAVTRTPADVMGLAKHGRIAVGGPADLVLFDARAYSELLSRPQADRIVLRNGRPIDTRLPSYRELDGLFA